MFFPSLLLLFWYWAQSLDRGSWNSHPEPRDGNYHVLRMAEQWVGDFDIGRNKLSSYVSHWIWRFLCYRSLLCILTNVSDYMRLIISIMVLTCTYTKKALISLQQTLLEQPPQTARQHKFRKRSKTWFIVTGWKSRKCCRAVEPAPFSLAASF